MANSVLNPDVDLDVKKARTVFSATLSSAFTVNSTDRVYIVGSGSVTFQRQDKITREWSDTTVTVTATSTEQEITESLVSERPNDIRFRASSGTTVIIRTDILVYQSVPLGGPPVVPEFRDWLPTDDTNTLLWLDASDSNSFTLDSNSRVTQWIDKSSSGLTFNLSSNSLQGPLSDGFKFIAGTSESFSAVNNSYGLSLQPEVTLVVLTNPSVGASRNIFRLGLNAPRMDMKLSNTESGIRYGIGNIVFNSASNLTRITSISKFGNTLGEATLHRNGVNIPESGRSNAKLQRDINTLVTTLYETNWSGDIWGYVLIRSSDSLARERAEGFLAHYHNQQSILDPSHPFKNSPPQIQI